MTDAGTDPGGFAERWRWLHPEEETRAARLAGRLWPDLGPAGRDARRRLLLGESAAAGDASGEDPGGLEAARLAERQRLIARALLELAGAPSPAALLAVLETGLDAAAEAELVQRRLARVGELLDPLAGEGPGAGAAADEGAAAAARLRQLLLHLERRFEGGPGVEALAGFVRLAALADRWEDEETPTLAGDPRADWTWRTGEALRPEELQARFTAGLEQTALELDKRCRALQARYLGGSARDDARSFVAAQLAEDRPPVERWERAHRDALAALAAWIGRRGLLPGDGPLPEPRVLAGARPAWPEIDSGRHALPAGRLPLADLTRLSPAGREAWLADRHTAALPVLLAREALPGRRWLLRRLRETDPLRGLLLRPADLDGWAGWAPEALFAAGWMSGEPRARIVHLRERLRELLLARADLQRLLELQPEAEIRRLLAREGELEGEPLAAAWRALEEHPGRWAAGALRRLELSAAQRRWRRRHGAAATPAAAIDLFSVAGTLPLPWIRERLHEAPPGGRELLELPPAVPALKWKDRDELVREVEERLAALGRIRREDLDAGSEFDDGAAPPAAPDEEAPLAAAPDGADPDVDPDGDDGVPAREPATAPAAGPAGPDAADGPLPVRPAEPPDRAAPPQGEAPSDA